MTESAAIVILIIIALFIFRKPTRKIVDTVNDEITLELLEMKKEQIERSSEIREELDELLDDEYQNPDILFKRTQGKRKRMVKKVNSENPEIKEAIKRRRLARR